MTERTVDLTNVARVDQDQRAAHSGLCAAHELIQAALRERAIRQSGDRVVIDLVSDVRLALCDRALHGVECGGQAAELIASGSLDGDLVPALLDTVRGLDELADRSRGAAAEQRADDRGDHECDSVDQQKRVTHVAIRRKYCLHRLLEHDIDRGPSGIEALRDTQELSAAHRNDAGAFGHRPRSVPSGDLQSLTLRQCRRYMLRSVATVSDESDVGADQITEALRERVIDGETHRGPGDRFRRTHRRKEELVRPIVEHGKVRQVASRA